jgi:hypothetical protein
MLWLPTWQDARDVLRSLGVTDAQVNIGLQEKRAIQEQRELLSLYEMIVERLTSDEMADQSSVAHVAR